jgi:hypothetical protein
MTQVETATIQSTMMAVAAARRLQRHGLLRRYRLPRFMNLARATHVPDCVLIYERHDRREAGAPAFFDRRRRACGDRGCRRFGSRGTGYWLQGGWVDVGFCAPRSTGTGI